MTLDLTKPNPSTLLAAISDPVFHIDENGIVTHANPAAVAMLSRHTDPVIGASSQHIFPDAFGATFNRDAIRAIRFGLEVRFEEQYLPLNTWLEVHIYPNAGGATVLLHDTADRRRDADLVEDHARVLEQIARGRPTKGVLEAITGLVERHGNGLVAAVFAADRNVPSTRNVPGTSDVLRAAVGPGLPPDYLLSVDRLEVRPDGSPVGQSVFTLKSVILSDLLVEPCEPKFRESAVKHGLRSCWATPIVSTSGARLGALAVYRREPGRPTSDQFRLLQTAANLAGIALDTQWKDADLREKEQEYRSIVETVQDALIVADMQGTIVEVNPAASRMQGSEYDALLGKQAMDLVRPDYHGVVRRLLDEVRQGREYHAEIVCTRRDGSSFPAEVTAVPFAFKGQRHLLAVVRDATPRKKMEDSLRRTEERLRTVVNGAPLVLFSLDRAGVFTLSEGQALSGIGLRPGEVVGKSAFDLYGSHPGIVDNLKLALSGEPRRFSSELSERTFETIVRPLRSHRGEIVGAVGVSIDTTEQTLTEEALAESEERFRASFHQAPIGAAHTSLDGVVLRVNEPLAAMLGLTPQEVVGRRLREWLADDAEREQDADAVRQLLSGALRVTATVRTLRGQEGVGIRAVFSLSLVRGRQGETRHLVYAITPLPG
ncbi:PAS domain S-box protein [Humisphaera borealis]|uniref:PAS domain S-box protein n=1 Tax=Humisphaera borealis TaxID=2807512 RepID=A0A7M2WU56_9BACT|nr:PAS domain S-box protein [Humisphaera borealis]QOV88331.1 PAS domain S-box protein [Humisphaera borealis]